VITIALPKGRLGDKVYELFTNNESLLESSRKLVFESKENDIRFLLVKPADVAIYVEHGAADLGIVGKDILLETHPEVYELMDLNIGKCKMAVAAKNDYIEDTDRTLRVATKFVNIAKDYYASKNREIEIIKLHGSVELAPLLGLSDVIVDIVESGNTLKANNLKVLTTFMDISARLIANHTSFKFKNKAIEQIVNGLTEVLKDDKNI